MRRTYVRLVSNSYADKPGAKRPVLQNDLQLAQVYVSPTGAQNAVREFQGIENLHALRVLAIPAYTIEKTASQQNVFVVIQDDVLLSINRLIDTMTELGDAWDQADIRHPILDEDVNARYPFHRDFQELIAKVIEWRDAVQAPVVEVETPEEYL